MGITGNVDERRPQNHVWSQHSGKSLHGRGFNKWTSTTDWHSATASARILLHSLASEAEPSPDDSKIPFKPETALKFRECEVIKEVTSSLGSTMSRCSNALTIEHPEAS
jgi:hypothetical protein